MKVKPLLDCPEFASQDNVLIVILIVAQRIFLIVKIGRLIVMVVNFLVENVKQV